MPFFRLLSFCEHLCYFQCMIAINYGSLFYQRLLCNIRMKNYESQPQKELQKSVTPISIPSANSHIPTLDIFSQANTKCSQNKQGTYACIQPNCKDPNPFICNISECQCSVTHQDCNQKKINSLTKAILSTQKQFSELDEVINSCLDSVNFKFSEKWNSVIDRLQLRASGVGAFSDNNQQALIKKAHDKNKLNGSLLSKIFNPRKLQAQSKYQKEVIKKIQQKAKEFEQKQLEIFFNYIEAQLFDKEIQFHPKIMNKTLERVSHLRLRCVTRQTEDNFSLGLIQPTINEMLKGEHKIIKWRVKIHFITHWIGIGISLKRFLERKDFNFNNYQIADHGSYIISSNEFVWSYRNKDRNFKKEGAFKLVMGDVVEVQLNMKEREITFTNERLNRVTTLKITHEPQNGDEYCIALGMYQEGDEAEILEPIEVCGEKQAIFKKETNLFQISQELSCISVDSDSFIGDDEINRTEIL